MASYQCEYFDNDRTHEIPSILAGRLDTVLTELQLGKLEKFRILEAGGGSVSYIKLPRLVSVTTIDISAEQIERNDYANEKICGDLENFDYQHRVFDAVICFNVIEHLGNPEKAISGFSSTVRERGAVLIVAPERRSLKGLITKYSPHWVHVLFYRHVVGDKNAGQPGHAPFPTYLRGLVSVDALAAELEKIGFDIRWAGRFVNDQPERLRRKFPPAFHVYRAASWLLRAATGGRYGLWHTDFFVLAQRRPTG